MLKKTMTYTDFNGEEITEDFYFHLSEAEISEMELDSEGGISQKLQKIINSKDITKIKEYFQWIILKSYGEKTDDGKHFIKNEKVSEMFSYTQAYSDLWMELITDANAAVKFVEGIMPKSVVDKAKQNDPEKYAQLFNKASEASSSDQTIAPVD